MEWIKNRDIESLTKYITEKTANNITRNGRTLLHEAVAADYPELVKLLLSKCADPDIADNEGLTPLHLAAEEQLVDIMRMLLDAGANVDARDNEGLTPLNIVYDEDSAKTLIEAGANVNIKDVSGSTPLHSAVYSYDDKLVALLLLNGADPNYRNVKGTSPLHEASTIGNLQIVRALIEAGARVNIQDKKSETPLFDAVAEGNKEIVQFLLENGADPNITNINNQTPLDIVTKKSIFELLAPYNNTNWLLICDILTDEYASQLKQITIQNVNEDNFDDISRTFKFTGDLSEFSDYVNSLPKRKICEYLSRYYILKKKCPSSTIDAIDRSDFEKDYQGEPLIFIEPNCYKLSNIVQWYDPGQENRRRDPVTRRLFTQKEIIEIEKRKKWQLNSEEI
jgi:ankyrin repeat protein